MDNHPANMDIEALAHWERCVQTRLDADPVDMESRGALAWCLFLQALYRFGRESTHALIASDNPTGIDTEHACIVTRSVPDHRSPKSPQPQRDAAALLSDSLRQLEVVLQLSDSEAHRSDMLKLQSLVSTCGAKLPLEWAQEEGAGLLAHIITDIVKKAPTLEPDSTS